MVQHRKNKQLLALLLPIILCVFILGWTMYWLGDTHKTKQKTKDNITIGPIAETEETIVC